MINISYFLYKSEGSFEPLLVTKGVISVAYCRPPSHPVSHYRARGHIPQHFTESYASRVRQYHQLEEATDIVHFDDSDINTWATKRMEQILTLIKSRVTTNPCEISFIRVVFSKTDNDGKATECTWNISTNKIACIILSLSLIKKKREIQCYKYLAATLVLLTVSSIGVFAYFADQSSFSTVFLSMSIICLLATAFALFKCGKKNSDLKKEERIALSKGIFYIDEGKILDALSHNPNHEYAPPHADIE